MMNSNGAAEGISKILEEISPSRLDTIINEPAIQVVSLIPKPESTQPNHELFVKFLIDLAQKLHSDATRLPLRLSDADAYTKALEWLEHHYPRQGGSGAEIAELEFFQDMAGTCEKVKHAVIAAFTNEERSRFIQNIFGCRIGCSWSRRVELTTQLLLVYGHYFPPGIASAEPTRFANSLESLIMDISQTESVFQT